VTFFVLLVAACLAAAGLALRLERHLPPDANVVKPELVEA
jgi:hypothetical protein